MKAWGHRPTACCRRQAGREAFASFQQYQSITKELLAEMKARGEPGAEDGSIGAHLLRIRDAAGRKLPDERLLPHIGMFFFAGFDTTGHTMAWTLCAAAADIFSFCISTIILYLHRLSSFSC